MLKTLEVYIDSDTQKVFPDAKVWIEHIKRQDLLTCGEYTIKTTYFCRRVEYILLCYKKKWPDDVKIENNFKIVFDQIY